MDTYEHIPFSNDEIHEHSDPIAAAKVETDIKRIVASDIGRKPGDFRVTRLIVARRAWADGCKKGIAFEKRHNASVNDQKTSTIAGLRKQIEGLNSDKTKLQGKIDQSQIKLANAQVASKSVRFYAWFWSSILWAGVCVALALYLTSR